MSETRFDIAINNARILDGTGGAPMPGSIGIRNGLIAEIHPEMGESDALTGAETIDAQGQILCPGFIDLHSHADFSLISSPEAITQLTQGVTTLLTGNCGTSPFPVSDLAAIQAATSFLRPELDWSWTDAAGFTEALHRSRPAVNAALQVGHGALRIAAKLNADRAPTPEELERMCDLLRQAAGAGVHGFSTGLIYAPGSFAATAEVEALAHVAAECGLLYSTHMRNETDNLLESVAEAIAVARLTGVRLEISHIKAMGPRNHGKVEEALQMMSDARADGIDVTADVYPYTASSTSLSSRLPGWALDGGSHSLLLRLANQDQRQRISAALATRFDGEIDPAGIVLADLAPGKYSEWIGHSLAEIAAGYDITAHEAAINVLVDHDAAVAIINHAMADSDVEAALRDPHVSVASDGWIMTPDGDGKPHPRSFGTFTRVLGHYVRERGVLSLEEAVRKMTSLPASRAGLHDRGRIGVGLVADLAVFDPTLIADKSTYEQPWQLSEGVAHVIVGGRFALKDYKPMSAGAGRVLMTST
ncbi:D-aminoacylase [Arthrobacter sp. H5]|uniref:N-acyl-D-amino-acid deacylase family protein n=1 Tax=Arthrobacter sp. H5 TaxID=1267973 RepID=UPI00048718DC|nr:D-aminoacylase [Arthrobacter sp. H5]